MRYFVSDGPDMIQIEMLPALIAIVDDDPDIRSLIASWLSGIGAGAEQHQEGRTVLERNPAELSVVCLDVGLPDISGLEVLSGLHAADPELPVIVITAQRDIDTAVRAMREGAYDYLAKPLDQERFVQTLKRAQDRRELSNRVRELDRSAYAALPIVGESGVMREILRQVDQIRSSDIAACVLGESGVGKELVARAIHLSSRRRQGPFVALNCAAVPENLQESELFGHERGAFTGAHDTYRGRFEQASGGTLFLDEVGEMHPSTQVKLLRVLQERVFRRVGGTKDLPMEARIVSATNRDLEAEVRAGRFRSDLFFRLVAYPIQVPPLRTRRDDIPRLAGHILRKAGQEMDRPNVRISPDAIDRLAVYDWPGNVRELENVLHRALLSSRGSEIRVSDLPAELRSSAPPMRTPGASGEPSDPMLPPLPMRELERLAIVQALDRAGGNIDAAAKQLGIGRATIYRRLAQKSEAEPSRDLGYVNTQIPGGSDVRDGQ